MCDSTCAPGRACKECGGAVEGRRQWCTSCATQRRLKRERDRDQRRGPRPARNWTRDCKWCGLTFTDRLGGYWCRTCYGSSHVGPPVPELTPLCDRPQLSEVRRCRVCERVAPHGVGRDSFCSYRCENSHRRSSLTCAVTYGNCRRCGDLYCSRATMDSGFCSSACSQRAAKSRRKAFARTIKRSGESFTLREIADRDGWRCHLCGKKVPDREYAARDDDPTMDHLIPVSLGGQHLMTNVALAHNRCNWERGNREVAFQLRLVG